MRSLQLPRHLPCHAGSSAHSCCQRSGNPNTQDLHSAAMPVCNSIPGNKPHPKNHSALSRKHHAAMQSLAAATDKTRHTESLATSTSALSTHTLHQVWQCTQLKTGARPGAVPTGAPQQTSPQPSWPLHARSARYAVSNLSSTRACRGQYQHSPSPVPMDAYAAFTAAVCKGRVQPSAGRAHESYSSQPTRHRYRPVNISSSARRQFRPSTCARKGPCERAPTVTLC